MIKPWGLISLRPTLIGLSLLLVTATGLWGQSTQGAVSVTVTDPAGAVIPNATLELKANATNDLRTAKTQDSGIYRFVGLNIGAYTLTITQTGFSKAVVGPITVQAARTTDIEVALKLGTTSTAVEVNTEAEAVLVTSSNMVGTTIDVKQLEFLPLGGRDLTQLSKLTAGYTNVNGNGTWNGMPSMAQGNNIDGVLSSAGRMKFSGNSSPSVSPRLENIEEMTVQTDQLDVDQGFGQATMQINFVTRAGTNKLHGRLYEDFRNSALNANSWANNARGIKRSNFILNDFGGAIGGAAIKDKLFYFGSFGMSKQPGSGTASNMVLTSAAQAGNYSYVGTDGKTNSVNVLNLVKAYNPSLPSTINSVTANALAAINKSLTAGAVTASDDPIANNINWLYRNDITIYYPSFRVDYNATQSQRFFFSYNQKKQNQPSSSQSAFPGSDFQYQGAGYKSNSITGSLGHTWTVTPTVVNQFKVGFLYNPVWNPWYQGNPVWTSGTGTVSWNLPFDSRGDMSGMQYNLPISNLYPVATISDSLSWQKGKHDMKFGFSAYQEHDMYWNAPAGITNYNLGLANGDPALGAFIASAFPNASSAQLDEAKQLYAVLVGRVSGVTGQFGLDPKTKTYNQKPGSTYNLNELMRSWGLFAQDSWRVRNGLTINAGLRWDFTGDNYDLTGGYHNALPKDIYGPSGIGNVFKPGTLTGEMNPTIVARPHAYNGWKVSPQPQVGVAWKPDFKEGWKSKFLGDGSVVRAGFALRRFTTPQQYFWNQATNYGSLYFQQYYLNANNSGQAGTFAPGSLMLGDKLPALGYSPHDTYQEVAPLSDYTFTSLNYMGNVVNGMNPDIKQPYTQSWNVGYQKQLGQNRVLELRYNGSRTRNQWLSKNVNEVNIFENGFLDQFKLAQNNLKINQQHGFNSFANNGYSGQSATPIFDSAFAGQASGGAGAKFVDYTNANFINYLNTGQAGAFANTLAGIGGTSPYYCALVGSGFKPCATNGGYTGAGAGLPINFFQANPYAAGTSVQYMDADGYSSYHGLQIELRQQNWHGMQFNVNYTWSHTLGTGSPNDWTAASSQYTMRDLRLSYGPTLFDLRHVVHGSITADLPFGKGRKFMNVGGIADRILGGWTLGSLYTFQTGAPRLVTGGNMTVNDYGDGGVVLNGITAKDLQNSISVHKIGNAGYVNFVDSKYLSGGGANQSYIKPNTTAGVFGQNFYLYGPSQYFLDASLSKSAAITERIRFTIQAEFLNILNHQNFSWRNSAVQSSAFGTGQPTSGNNPRQIELRANIVF